MYNLEIKKKALKQMQSLPTKDQKRIISAFEILKENPLTGKRLEGEYADFRSLRVWPYRIIYAVDHHIVTITVVKVAHRKDVYR